MYSDTHLIKFALNTSPNDREWVRRGRWETAYCTGPTFLNAYAA